MRRNEGGLAGRSVCCPVQGEAAALGPCACPPKGSSQLHSWQFPALGPDASLTGRSRLYLDLQLGGHPPSSLYVLYFATPKLQTSCSRPKTYSKLWLRAETLFTQRLTTTSLQAKPDRMHRSSTCPGTPSPGLSLPKMGWRVPAPRSLHCHASPTVLSTECNLLGHPLLLP